MGCLTPYISISFKNIKQLFKTFKFLLGIIFFIIVLN